MRVLLIGDVVARTGRQALSRRLRRLRREREADLVVANGENAAGGLGLTPDTADDLFRAGVDVITTGNHVWDRPEIHDLLATDLPVLRPANYPEPCAGTGHCVVEAADGTPVTILNLIGRVFMSPVDDPFRAADRLVERIETRVSLVDFHAEATSEKVAMGRYLDGRVSVVVGTHTHVPTADERILPGGTAYQTDLGMTGPRESIIGVRAEQVLERFLTQRPVRFSAADGAADINGLQVDIDPDTGRATSVERVSLSGESR